MAAIGGSFTVRGHCLTAGICSQQLTYGRLGARDCSALLISIVSDVVTDSGGRTVAWEADRLLYLETSAVIR